MTNASILEPKTANQWARHLRRFDVPGAHNPLADAFDQVLEQQMTPEEAHEASQGAYRQAAWLEERANREPTPGPRCALLHRAEIAFRLAEKLR